MRHNIICDLQANRQKKKKFSSPLKMAAEPTREWSDEQLKSDDLPKKDMIKFIQDNAAHSVRLSLECVCDCSLYSCRLKL